MSVLKLVRARKIERLWQWSVGGVPVPFSLVGDAGVCVCLCLQMYLRRIT